MNKIPVLVTSFIRPNFLQNVIDIIEKRNGKKMGFRTISDESEFDDSPLPEDLIHFGLIPEFVGRFPLIQRLNKLRLEDLERIITEPQNSIVNQYKKIFKYDNKF